MDPASRVDADVEVERVELPAILDHLSQEITRPLALLHQGIGRLLGDPSAPLIDAERDQAVTMLTLCVEIDRLTREFFGRSDPNPA